MKDKFIYKIFFTIFLVSFSILKLSSQNFENPLKNGYTVFFGKDSVISIRTIALFQIQTRYLQLNPNSISPLGIERNQTIDIAIPRICLGGFLKYKNVNLFYLFGTSSQTIVTAKQGNFYNYETYISYNILKNKLILGTGQSLYNGISRATSLSITKLIAVEPIPMSIPTGGKSDQIARQYHIFATGTINKFEYRTALVRPMLQVGNSGNILPDLSSNQQINTSIEFPSDKFGAEGYYSLQFFDTESTLASAKSFSYLGQKKILNFGVGFEYQPNATACLTDIYDTVFNNTITLGADLFADIPLKTGAVFTTYAVFYNFDYGQNYLKKGGSMNYFSGGSSPQGAGISEYVIGTGNAFALQMAWLFAKKITKEEHRLQIYGTFYYKNFEALNQISFQPGGGLNYYILEHNAKISSQYYLRNIYNQELKISEQKNNFVVQFQIYF